MREHYIEVGDGLRLQELLPTLFPDLRSKSLSFILPHLLPKNSSTLTFFCPTRLNQDLITGLNEYPILL
ncbi:unnamed protein product [Rhodiola kirilowii]